MTKGEIEQVETILKVVVLLGITKAQGQGQEDEGDRTFIAIVLAMIGAVMVALVKGLAALICRMKKKMMDEDEVKEERPQNQPKDEVGKNQLRRRTEKMRSFS